MPIAMKRLAAAPIVVALFISRAGAQTEQSDPTELIYLHCPYETTCFFVTVSGESKPCEGRSGVADFIIDTARKKISESGKVSSYTITQTPSSYDFSYASPNYSNYIYKSHETEYEINGTFNRQTGTFSEQFTSLSKFGRETSIYTGSCERVNSRPRF
jgi:hypothetical protein